MRGLDEVPPAVDLRPRARDAEYGFSCRTRHTPVPRADRSFGEGGTLGDPHERARMERSPAVAGSLGERIVRADPEYGLGRKARSPSPVATGRGRTSGFGDGGALGDPYERARMAGSQDRDPDVAGSVGNRVIREDPEYGGMGRKARSPRLQANHSSRDGFGEGGCLGDPFERAQLSPAPDAAGSVGARIARLDPEYGLGRRGLSPWQQTDGNADGFGEAGCLGDPFERARLIPLPGAAGSLAPRITRLDPEYGLGRRGLSPRGNSPRSTSPWYHQMDSQRSQPGSQGLGSSRLHLYAGRPRSACSLNRGEDAKKSINWTPPSPRPTRPARAKVLEEGARSMVPLAGEYMRPPPLPLSGRATTPLRRSPTANTPARPAWGLSWSARSRSPSRCSSRGSSSARRAPQGRDGLGLCWSGTSDGGWDDGNYSSALWTRRRSPSGDAFHKGHGDVFCDGGLPNCISRGRRKASPGPSRSPW